MKTNFTFATILLVAVVTAPNAKAGVLGFDNFNYLDGALVPNNGWANYSGSGSLQVESGQAIIKQDGSSEQDVKLSFTPTAGKLYYGLDFSVDDPGSAFSATGDDFEYFATFHDDTAANQLSARMDIQAPGGTGDFTIGIASDNGTADASWGTDLTFGTTYRAVVSYDQVDNLAELWLDPTSELSIKITGVNLAVVGDTVGAFALRQATNDDNGTANGITVRVDGVAIGTTFADVVTAVPEPGSAAILAVGLFGLISRRRRN